MITLTEKREIMIYLEMYQTGRTFSQIAYQNVQCTQCIKCMMYSLLNAQCIQFLNHRMYSVHRIHLST